MQEPRAATGTTMVKLASAAAPAGPRPSRYN